MQAVKRWNVAIEIDEHDGRTRAVARLDAGVAELTGVGLARRSPEDQDVPGRGDREREGGDRRAQPERAERRLPASRNVLARWFHLHAGHTSTT